MFSRPKLSLSLLVVWSEPALLQVGLQLLLLINLGLLLLREHLISSPQILLAVGSHSLISRLARLSFGLGRNQFECLLFKEHGESEAMGSDTPDQLDHVHLLFHVIFHFLEGRHVSVPVLVTAAHATHSSVPESSEAHLPKEHDVLFLLGLCLFLECFYANCAVVASRATTEYLSHTKGLVPRVQAVSDISCELRASKVGDELGRKETYESHETTDASD